MAASKNDLTDWLYQALKDMNGHGTTVELCRHI